MSAPPLHVNFDSWDYPLALIRSLRLRQSRTRVLWLTEVKMLKYIETSNLGPRREYSNIICRCKQLMPNTSREECALHAVNHATYTGQWWRVEHSQVAAFIGIWWLKSPYNENMIKCFFCLFIDQNTQNWKQDINHSSSCSLIFKSLALQCASHE